MINSAQLRLAQLIKNLPVRVKFWTRVKGRGIPLKPPRIIGQTFLGVGGLLANMRVWLARDQPARTVARATAVKQDTDGCMEIGS